MSGGSGTTQAVARPGAPRFQEAPGTYVLVGVLLGITVVALLAVPTYAHLTPALGGIPFFYWYTMLWLLLNAVLQTIAYRVLVRVGRERRGGSR